MQGCVVHWEVADPRGSHDQCPGQWAGVKAFHERQGYGPDTAYNFGFCQHGGRFNGRGWDRQSAANGRGVPFNQTHYAFCWMGGPGHTPSSDALTACRGLLDEAAARENATDWIAHSDCVPTQCPGDDLRDWVHAGAPVAPPTPAPSQGDPTMYVSTTKDEGWFVVEAGIISSHFTGPVDPTYGVPLELQKPAWQAVPVKEMHAYDMAAIKKRTAKSLA